MESRTWQLNEPPKSI